MSSESTNQVIQELLGPTYHMENDYWVNDENGVRIEVAGACSDTHDSHFNIYMLVDGKEVGQSLGIPKNNLTKEIASLRKLINK